MTMKKELTLKHGVFIAAAVLLIAGIAFAGAAAAEPTHINWTATEVSNAISTGGDYIVDVPSKTIKNLFTTSKTNFGKNLTLDFNSQTVSIGECVQSLSSGDKYSGGLFGGVFVDEGKVITIKNLVIDGGVTLEGTMVGALIGFSDGQTPGKKVGCWIIENVTVKNVSIVGKMYASNSNPYTGGLFGALNTQGAKFVNCTVEGCDISTEFRCGGGIIGIITTASPCIIENCLVKNTYVHSGTVDRGTMGSGLLVGSVSTSGSLIAVDSSVENSIINAPGSNVNGGLLVGISYVSGSSMDITSASQSIIKYIGGALVPSVRIVGCDVNNCVAISSNGMYAGGVFGSISNKSRSSTVTAENNEISSCTIVNTASDAGGFAGYMTSAAVASVSGNRITNCCVVATNGNAAGFCPAVV